MNKSARAFDNNNSFMIDLIDTFKGTGHCEKQWAKQLKKTSHQVKRKKFWRQYVIIQ